MLLDGEASRLGFEDAFNLDRHPVMQLLHANGRRSVAAGVTEDLDEKVRRAVHEVGETVFGSEVIHGRQSLPGTGSVPAPPA